MNDKLDKLKTEFQRIKNLGFVDCTRPNNTDGGIGNTFEDLLGVVENNKKEADFLGFEIKSKRKDNSSYISLFSKSPTDPKRANSYLRETFGEYRDPNHPDKKKLYASVFGNKYSTIYDKYKMKLDISHEKEMLSLIINNLDGALLSTVNWTFESLIKASKKMKSLLLVQADIKHENSIQKYHYNKAEIYYEFDFSKFLSGIETGKIMFDIRIGVYSSGKSIGKTHDHGSGFRVKYDNFGDLYKTFEEI